ncbi:hypothetical protein GJV44_00769 [Candidatus Vallotia cooleyia]|nr:hypothetical protein GJV44_00769 [Candidatus Vallotia cooleyia]
MKYISEMPLLIRVPMYFRRPILAALPMQINLCNNVGNRRLKPTVSAYKTIYIYLDMILTLYSG